MATSVPTGHTVSPIDHANLTMAFQQELPGAALRLALLALQDDWVFDNAEQIREMLGAAEPKTWEELTALLDESGIDFRLRRVNGVRMETPRGSLVPFSFVRELVTPFAFEKLRRDAPILTVEEESAARGDPELASDLDTGDGIFGDGGHPTAVPAPETDYLGPTLSRQGRHQLIRDVERSFAVEQMVKEDKEAVATAIEALHSANERSWETSPESAAATVTLVRETATQLADFGISEDRTGHQGFIYAHTARMMELGGLVRPRASDDPDGARFERVRKALQRYAEALRKITDA